MRYLAIISLVGVFLVTGMGVGQKGKPRTFTVHAQSLPTTRTVTWDANPVAEGVTSYPVSFDTVAVGAPTTTSQVVTFTTGGTHTITVRAINQWSTGPVTTITVNVVVPSAPANVRIVP